jgi:hypothetical protein
MLSCIDVILTGIPVELVFAGLSDQIVGAGTPRSLSLPSPPDISSA